MSLGISKKLSTETTSIITLEVQLMPCQEPKRPIVALKPATHSSAAMILAANSMMSKSFHSQIVTARACIQKVVSSSSAVCWVKTTSSREIYKQHETNAIMTSVRR